MLFFPVCLLVPVSFSASELGNYAEQQAHPLCLFTRLWTRVVFCWYWQRVHSEHHRGERIIKQNAENNQFMFEPAQVEIEYIFMHPFVWSLLWSHLQAVSLSAGKESPLWATIENLQRGVSWHRMKPFLIFEVRYFQATTLGLPLEISKYYESVNGITVNGEEANPAACRLFTNKIFA